MNTAKIDLIQDTAAASGRTQTEVRAVIEKFLAAVFQCAKKEWPVEIRGFGTFYTKERKPRPARNPRTGAIVPLPKRRILLFRYSPELKEDIGLCLGLPYASPARFESAQERRNIASHARAFIKEKTK